MGNTPISRAYFSGFVVYPAAQERANLMLNALQNLGSMAATAFTCRTTERLEGPPISIQGRNESRADGLMFPMLDAIEESPGTLVELVRLRRMRHRYILARVVSRSFDRVLLLWEL